MSYAFVMIERAFFYKFVNVLVLNVISNLCGTTFMNWVHLVRWWNGYAVISSYMLFYKNIQDKIWQKVKNILRIASYWILRIYILVHGLRKRFCEPSSPGILDHKLRNLYYLRKCFLLPWVTKSLFVRNRTIMSYYVTQSRYPKIALFMKKMVDHVNN